MKCWCMVHAQGIWMAQSLIGMKIVLWWLRACQEKKKGKTLRRHKVLCSWKCLLPYKDSAVLFSLLLLKIFFCLIPTNFLILFNCMHPHPPAPTSKIKPHSHTFFWFCKCSALGPPERVLMTVSWLPFMQRIPLLLSF